MIRVPTLSRWQMSLLRPEWQKKPANEGSGQVLQAMWTANGKVLIGNKLGVVVEQKENNYDFDIEQGVIQNGVGERAGTIL